jgi:4-hydroxybenzoate polyprenyltransferase
MISGLVLSFILNINFGLILLIYTVLMIAYSLFLKDIVILDVLIISSGFVMRAIGGAQAIHVTISPWLLICTTLLALFLGFAKRREELVGLGIDATNHRPCLEHYNIAYLDQLLSITAGLTIMSYALYTFLSDTGIKHSGMYFTLVFVIYGIFRYLLMASNNLGVSTPEVLLIKDRPLLINFILWMLTCAVIILR